MDVIKIPPVSTKKTLKDGFKDKWLIFKHMLQYNNTDSKNRSICGLDVILLRNLFK